MSKKVPQKLIRLSEMNPGGQIFERSFGQLVHPFYKIGEYNIAFNKDTKGKLLFAIYKENTFKFKSRDIYEVSKALHRLTGM